MQLLRPVMVLCIIVMQFECVKSLGQSTECPEDPSEISERRFVPAEVSFLEPPEFTLLDLARFGGVPLYQEFVESVSKGLANPTELTEFKIRAFAVHRVFKDSSNGIDSPATIVNQCVLEFVDEEKKHVVVLLSRIFPLGAEETAIWNAPQEREKVLRSATPLTESQVCDFAVNAGFGNRFASSESAKCLLIEWYATKSVPILEKLSKVASSEERRARLRASFNENQPRNKLNAP